MPYSARIKELKGQITDLRQLRLVQTTEEKQQDIEDWIESLEYILEQTEELQESHV